jgi:hypothetical protein
MVMTVGERMANARIADIVDASVIQLADDGHEVLTSDLVDLSMLATAARKTIIVTHVS